ncbi:protein roadkill [Caerostris extrusa]|uniref:Protein roadkill n=1 Tax=Caerostris extrusa TaxID=172846 RepID=A0AAV4P627_CAEEX|nr:protein roadkill [Caerostris extrusa]
MSYCWQNEFGSIESPPFVADTMEGTKWKLQLFPRGDRDGKYIGFYLWRDRECSSLNDVAIDLELSFLDADGSVLTARTMEKKLIQKGRAEGSLAFANGEDVFVRREIQVSARRRADCSVPDVEVRRRGGRKPGVFRPHPSGGGRNIFRVEHQAVRRPAMRPGSRPRDTFGHGKRTPDGPIQFSVLDATGGRLKCFGEEIRFHALADEQRQFRSHITKSRLMEEGNTYLPGDVLSLLCECMFYTGVVQEEIETCRRDDVHLQSAGAGESPHASARGVTDDARFSSEDEVPSDVRLKSKTGSFLAHKLILGAHSPVFEAMFATEESESVDLHDLEHDTVRRMLQYVYTGDVEELDWEDARRLYSAADTYEVLPLKDRCSSHLKADLRPANACEALVLSDLHQDADMKRAALDFVLEHFQDVMQSDGWKVLVDTNPKLAAETMLLKLKG